MTITTIDLYAGIGGWDEGAIRAGLPDPVGIEIDKAACATRHAAGHLTIRADVSMFPVKQIGFIDTLIASPPCQAFSTAGKKRGLGDMDKLMGCAERGEWHGEWADDRSGLVLQPLRWVAATRPRMILLEQVPPVLSLWKRFAATWDKMGYRSWVGILNSADFGVPQTRKRAILIARLDCQPLPPEPTHAKSPGPGLFGTLDPWISMADALGWGIDGDPAYTVAAPNGGGCGDGYGGSGARNGAKAARDEGRWRERQPNVLNTGRDWKKGGTRDDAQKIPTTRPAPTITGESNQSWWQTIPSPTVVGSFHPEVVAKPGWRTSADASRQNTPDSVIITPEEGLVLQSFRSDYPVQGSKTNKWQQVGNAIPPLLAQHIIESQLRHPTERK